ncbi:hypothetical protein PV04_04713 [Phialophora macrospora]|uniref:Uncharacterized protein n=1 Tax=Phialophora macrospora TaxID=1851006 RepID=A0A0D2E374_9EURO|nr:hypothetical protein PV04_04713 [Phialophora macrospora]
MLEFDFVKLFFGRSVPTTAPMLVSPSSTTATEDVLTEYAAYSHSIAGGYPTALFSEDVFASLPERLGLGADAVGSPNLNGGHLTPVPQSPSLFTSPGHRGKSEEYFDFPTVVQLLPSHFVMKGQNLLAAKSANSKIEESRALRAMDSFERAIFQSRPPYSPVELKLVASQTPVASTPGISPSKSDSHDISLFCSPTKPDVSSIESELVCYGIYPAEYAAEYGSTKRWRLFLGRRRRLLYMLATVLFVIVAATAIAGGVIWKLTTLGQMELSKRQ